MLYYVHPKLAAGPISYTLTIKAVRILCVGFHFVIREKINENSSADCFLTGCAALEGPITDMTNLSRESGQTSTVSFSSGDQPRLV